MNTNTIIEAFERFFLDIIGSVIPGFILFFGFFLILEFPFSISLNEIIKIPNNDGIIWIMLIVISYILGHALNSFGSNIIIKMLLDPILSFCSKHPSFNCVIPKSMISNSNLIEHIRESIFYKKFTKKIYNIDIELKNEQNVHEWRNIALTMSKEDNHTVYRFMFISLFNLGIATSLIILSLIWIILFLLEYFGLVNNVVNDNVYVVVPMIFVSFLLLERRYDFYSRAIRVPFSMALANLLKKISDKSNDKSDIPNCIKTDLKVYLAGGFHSGWQDVFINEFQNWSFIDPRIHKHDLPVKYTFWDLAGINDCDLVVANLEEQNPSGYNLAFEIGYAKALGKKIILIDEKSFKDRNLERYLGMLRSSSDIVFDTLEDTIKYLKTLQN